MIFVTTGTNGEPFDRLLREVGRIHSEDLVVQHGPSAVRPEGATCVDYVGFSALVELVRNARVVVTHGGVGSILVALTNGKRPLVVPRLARFGEAVDDHQLELSTRLDEIGLVTLVENVVALPELVEPESADPPSENGHSSTALVDDLRHYLSGPDAHGHHLGRDPRN